MSFRGAAKSLGALALLQVPLPAVALVTGAGVVRSLFHSPERTVAERPRTVLLSGGKMTKALQLARSFHAAGHRVILVESAKYRVSGHRFSLAVDRFATIPEPADPGYAAALVDLVVREGVDVYVPVCSPVASYHDALAKDALSQYCEVLHVDADLVSRLDDKEAFARLSVGLGLCVPDSHRVTSPAQVADFPFPEGGRRYILKSIVYDPVRRLDLTPLPRPTPAETAQFVHGLPISEATPWVLQEFVTGKEFCTHTTAREGEVQAYCCCPSSSFQVNYTHVDKPEIEAWVRRFVSDLKLTGQVSFDFLEADDGTVYAIECNPRTHSAITMFYNHPDLAKAYLETGTPCVRPLDSSRPTYWLYHEVWRVLRDPRRLAERARVVWEGKEAVFDWSDPLPFLLVNHVQIPWLLLRSLLHGRGFERIDFNIGKLVQAAGD